MHRRCDRNRKRSKRRAIYCPIHTCYLDSVSQKYPLFADSPEKLQQRGVNRQETLMLATFKTAATLNSEWLEAFWCKDCQKTKWYHIHKSSTNTYEVAVASPELWQQALKVAYPHGNPSVSEFTSRNSRTMNYLGHQNFNKIC
ncbi:MAG: hypothetical protein QNJ36_06205 [Calothrix sp. MO_167.B42]|nr:hypothetical protein [Calothrix sp. MO_167.B42]